MHSDLRINPVVHRPSASVKADAGFIVFLPRAQQNVQMPPMRNRLTEAKRVVVKVGTRVLVDRNGRPNRQRIKALAYELADLRKKGMDVALVSSGAVGAGIEALGMTSRPKTLPELQMAAAIGQTRLMALYEKPFAEKKCKIGQVLLTYDDLNNRERHLNIRHTVKTLFEHGVIPIINENDVVSVNEIKVGDNDVLAALFSIMIHADLLILLTTTNGLKETLANGKTRVIPYLEKIDENAMNHVKGKESHLSTGGMETKLLAAQKASSVDIPTVIADGRKEGVISSILQGRKIGTLIAASNGNAQKALPARKRWIAYFHRANGSVAVDDGAKKALLKKGTSLLPIGIKQVTGTFSLGSVINIKDREGETFARGLVDYSSEDIAAIMGHNSKEIRDILGTCDYEEVIHRDNMVIFND